MSNLLDEICTQISTSELVIIGTIIFGLALASLFIDLNKYVKLGILSAITIILILFFDTICLFPLAKASFKTEYDNVSIPCFMQRQHEMDIIQKEILPTSKRLGGYYLFEGLRGSGKTTLLQQSILTYEQPNLPHVYVNIAPTGDVTENIYKALKVHYYCYSLWAEVRSYMNIPSLACPEDPKQRLLYILNVAVEAAALIHKEEGIPPLIIFDGTTRILQTDVGQLSGEKVIHLLQDMAKDAADKGTTMFLFASSESAVPNIMRSRSAKSRMISTFKLGDITDEEAFEYLTCMCPEASKELITEAVNLFGGRFIHLKHVADYINMGKVDLAAYKENVYRDIQTTINQLPRKVMMVLIDVVENILQSPQIMTVQHYLHNSTAEITEDDLKLIDRTNILDIDHRKGVFFASRIVKKYFQENLSLYTT